MESDIEAEPFPKRNGLIGTPASCQALIDLLETDDLRPRAYQDACGAIDIDHSIQSLAVVKVVRRHRQLVLHTPIVMEEAAKLRDIRLRRNALVARWVQ
jgi:hypothetical protein